MHARAQLDALAASVVAEGGGGKPTERRPGGDHVMLMDLKQPLKAGETFPLTLTFEKAGPKQVTVRVEKAGAKGTSPSGHEHHSDAAHRSTGTDGGPGDASEVSRTVRVETRDTAFSVKQIPVKAGETIRFVITNKGETPHEFAIASAKEHAEHRAMMRRMPDMVRDETNVVAVPPDETNELIWKFGKDTDVEFACDIPGHAEQGMQGTFRVMR